MEQFEITRRSLQYFFIGQTCRRIFSGKASDIVSSVYRVLERLRREIRRTCVSAPNGFALTQEYRDANTLVFVLLNGLDLAFANRNRQPLTLADLDHSIRRALVSGEAQHIAGDLFQLILAVSENSFVHGGFYGKVVKAGIIAAVYE